MLPKANQAQNFSIPFSKENSSSDRSIQLSRSAAQVKEVDVVLLLFLGANVSILVFLLIDFAFPNYIHLIQTSKGPISPSK